MSNVTLVREAIFTVLDEREWNFEDDEQRVDFADRVASFIPSETQRPMPEGWKLVPVDPTLEMLEAAADAYDGSSFRERRMYKAMLEAAPETIQPECKATPSSYGGGASCEQRWHCEKCGDVTDAHHCPLGHASAHCPMIQSSDKPNWQKDACSARLDAVLADYGRGGDSLPYNHQRIERLARQYASALDEIALVLDVPDNHAADLDEIAAIVRRTQ